MSITIRLKQRIFSWLDNYGYRVIRIPKKNDKRLSLGLRDKEFYQPFLSPWLSAEIDQEFAQIYNVVKASTMVRRESCWILYSLAKQALSLPGDFCELGVYKGGSAYILLQLLKKYNKENPQHPKALHLFDTFSGMPETVNAKDWHKGGDFMNTSLDSVKHYLGSPDICQYHSGLVPASFAEVDLSKLVYVHIDLDLYDSIYAATEAIFPKLRVGGMMVFDDYGFPTCSGARDAIDDYFRLTKYVPIVLPTGQAIVFKVSP